MIMNQNIRSESLHQVTVEIKKNLQCIKKWFKLYITFAKWNPQF